MPAGASAKREREYEKLKRKFKQSGRYGKRASEVAARIVNKQRAQYGETKSEQRKDREGKSPDRSLPIPHYQELTVAEISDKLGDLSRTDLQQIERYEKQHKHRKGVLQRIERKKAA